MKIFYLVNQYPSVSHTFIRREIQAIERLGMVIERVTIRKSVTGICDSADVEELERTKVILDESALSFIYCLLRTLLRHPYNFVVALKEALFLGRKDPSGVIRYFFYLVEACLLLSWANKSKIDHIHSHFGTNATAVALLCRKLGGPSFSFTVHGSEEFDAPVALSLAEKIDNADFVVAVSNYCCAQLMRWSNYRNWSKIHVVRCTVDRSFLEGSKIPNFANNRLVFVGRLCKEKGLFLLLDALKILSKKGIDFEMVFIGDGELRHVLEDRINEFCFEKKVTITGWLRGSEIRKIISESRAFVLPSFAEGLPVVIMEALGLERPVISTYVAGIPELVDSQCGRLVPAGSRTAIAKAIEDILKMSKDELAELGRVGAERVKTYHNDKIEAEKLYSLFNSIR